MVIAGTGFTVSEKVLSEDCAAPSVARTVKLKLDAEEGVPLNNPVELSVTPLGRPPLPGASAQVMDPVPPVADNCCE